MNSPLIKFAGVLDPLLLPDVLEVVVDTNVFLPAMCTVLIKDDLSLETGLLRYSDNLLQFSIGTPLEIAFEQEGSILPVVNTVFKGEITSVEPVFQDDGQVLLRIRAYDLSHRLTYGKVTRTFGDGNPFAETVTDQMIISQIAAGYGLIPKVESTSVRYNYVMQYNESDWDFLQARAEQLGFQMYVAGRTLHFEDAAKQRYLKSPEDLVWGSNLSKFMPRIATAGTVKTVEVYGWDPDSKKTVKGSKTKGKNNFVSTGETVVGSIPLNLKMKLAAEDVIIDPKIKSSGKANKFAEARLNARESQFVRASGEIPLGDPYMLAGTKVKISGVGVRFAGNYYVTEAKHIWRSGNYSTRFEVSGRNPHTLRNMLKGENGSKENGKVPGVSIGVVTDLADPEKLGRVKVKFPWMPAFRGADLESKWVRVASLGGGNERGILFLPEIDDEVLISFENGDINTPFIVGTLWNKKDKPPKGKILDPASKKVNERVIRSRTGHVIILDDTQGAEKILIKDKTEKNTIEIDSKTNAMTFKTAGDFTIDAGGKFIVKSKMDMMLDSKGKGGFKAVSGMEVDCAAGAKMKAGASELDLGAAGAALKGAKVDVQGSAQASIKGSAMVEIQGGIVKIN